MFSQITQVIRASRGYVYVSAGKLTGYFDDPALTRRCADVLKSQFHCQIEICGCELSISK